MPDNRTFTKNKPAKRPLTLGSIRSWRGLCTQLLLAGAITMPTFAEHLHLVSPPAILQGQPIDQVALNARLAETAGAIVLDEMILDRLLDEALAADRRTVSDADVSRERQLLLETMGEDAGVDAAGAAIVLERVRRNRGLGPVRFDALLKRNASLRALVRDSVIISPEQMAMAIDLEFGPRARARVISMADPKPLSALRAELTDATLPPGSTERVLRFAEAALARSTDASAARGGLFDSMSTGDPGLPLAIRGVLPNLKPGEVSELIALEQGFAIVLLEKMTPARGTPGASERARVERRLRTRLERIAMDVYARNLVEQAKITVFDDALRWSWEHR